MSIERSVQTVSYTVVGIFLGLMIADGAPSSVKIAREWQTLVAGILAVFAAYLTIRQMRISDQLNQDRHLEVRRAEFTRERMVARRAAALGAHEIRFAVDLSRERRASISVSSLVDNFDENGTMIEAIQQTLRGIVSRPAISEARLLLDAAGDRSLALALDDLDSVKSLMEAMREHRADPDLKETSADAAETVLSRLDRAMSHLERLAEELGKLLKRYDVTHS